MWALRVIDWAAKTVQSLVARRVKMQPFVQPGTASPGVWLIFGKTAVWVSMN